jgi:hypothetical protein
MGFDFGGMFHVSCTLYKIAPKTPSTPNNKNAPLPTFSLFNEYPTPQYYTKTLQMYNAFLKLSPNNPNTKQHQTFPPTLTCP